MNEALRVAQYSGKIIIAMKPFATGRIPPTEALEYIAGILFVDAVAIGASPLKEARESFGYALNLWKRRYTKT